MDIYAILDIAAKLVAVLIACVLLPAVKKFLDEKVSEKNRAVLIHLVTVFVEAAEQLLKEDDPTGEKRKAYVVEQLKLLGFEITTYIENLIESNVFNLNYFDTKNDEFDEFDAFELIDDED